MSDVYNLNEWTFLFWMEYKVDNSVLFCSMLPFIFGLWTVSQFLSCYREGGRAPDITIYKMNIYLLIMQEEMSLKLYDLWTSFM